MVESRGERQKAEAMATVARNLSLTSTKQEARMCMTTAESAKYNALVDAGVEPTEAWNRIFNRSLYPESPSDEDVASITDKPFASERGAVAVGV